MYAYIVYIFVQLYCMLYCIVYSYIVVLYTIFAFCHGMMCSVVLCHLCPNMLQ